MREEASRPKIGLLGLTLALYEEISPGLRESREEWVRREVIPALREVADVSFSGACWTRKEVAARVADFEVEEVDAILVMLLTYSPSQVALPVLRRTSVPLAVWNTQELFAVNEDFDGTRMIENHGVHGTQDLANVLLRSGVEFHYVTSHLDDPRGLAELTDFFAAARAARRLGQARLGILGYPFPGMGDFAVDTTEMVATLGCEWLSMPMEEYVRRAAEAPEEAVEMLVGAYRDSYELAPDLAEDSVVAAARAEVSLRAMVAERGLDAFTYQFMAFGEDERAPTVPFVGASRLMADGLGFGGEGDLLAAAGSALLNWLQPPATFAEMFTIDFGGNGVLMSHMGEMNLAMARSDRRPRLVARSRAITGTGAQELVAVAALQPGPATLFALTPGAQGWRLIGSAVEVVDYGPLDSMTVPHFKLKPAGDVREFLTAYARAGGPHHCAVCFGDARQRVEVAARLLEADYVEV